MKTTKHNEKEVSLMTSFYNSDVVEYMENVHLEYRNAAVAKGEELAEMNAPDPMQDLRDSTSHIEHSYNDLKAKVYTKLNVESLMGKGASIKSRYDAKEDELKEKRTITQNKLRKLEKLHKKNDASDVIADLKTWRSVNFIILLTLLGEAIFTESAFGGVTNQGILARLLLGVLVGISTYFIVKGQTIGTRRIQSPSLKVGFFVLMTAGMVALTYSLSILRMAYLSKADPEMASRVSPIMFTIVSLIFYAGVLVASLFYYVDRDDRKRAQEHRTREKELDALKKECNDLEQRLAELPVRREEALYEIFSLIKMAENYLAQCDHLYAQTISEFILINNLTREDGKTIGASQFKGGEIPPLKQYQFKTIEL